MWQRWKIPVTVLALLAVSAWLIHKTAASREWTEFRSDRFWQGVAQVRVSYLILAAFLIFCSYFLRSLRWRKFLEPIKAASLINIFSATLIGFSAVALLGRPGELVRPMLIARKEKLTLSSQLAAWTLERIFDALTIGMMLGVALASFPPAAGEGGVGPRVLTRLKTAGILLCAISLVFAALLAQLRRRSALLGNILLWLARAVPRRHRSGFEKSLAAMLTSFLEGLASIDSLPRFGLCTLYSVLVWIPVVGTYWLVVHGFGWPMSALGLGAVLLLISTSVVGSLAQLPGIGGGPQLAIFFTLTQLFGIPLEIASTAAILLWFVCFMIVLVPGLLLAAHEGLSWQRLRAIVKTNVKTGSPGGEHEDVPTLTPDSP